MLALILFENSNSALADRSVPVESISPEAIMDIGSANEAPSKAPAISLTIDSG